MTKAVIGKTYHPYKGNAYTVISVAEHTETNELFVIYRDKAGDVWARPKDMWESKVEFKGEELERFTLL